MVAAAGLVIAGSMLASAQAAPVLPHRSAAALIADALSARPPAALSGQVTMDASLGLPELPQSDLGGSMPGYSLLAGSHSFSFWSDGPGRLRIAIPVQLGETDLRVNGRSVWLWNSRTNTATHVVLPAGLAAPGAGWTGTGPAKGGWTSTVPAAAGWSGTGPAAGWSGTASAGAGRAGNAPGTSSAQQVSDGGVTQEIIAAGPPTPQQAAKRILAAVGPTTTVSVQSNVMVAGQAAYQLALAPKSSGSLIGQIRIAIDARGYLPLRLQVFARGATSPAYQVGFTSLSFARPAASNFTFTPPSGATVKTITVPRLGPGLLGGPALGLGGLGGLGLGGGLPVGPPPHPIAPHCRPVSHKVAVKGSGGPGQTLSPIMRCLPGSVHVNVSPRSGAVQVAPGLPLKLRQQLRAALKIESPARRIAALRKLSRAIAANLGKNGGGFTNLPAQPAAGQPQVIGTGWLSVLVFHAAGAVEPMLGDRPPPMIPAIPAGPQGAVSSGSVRIAPGTWSVYPGPGGSSAVSSAQVAGSAPALAVNPVPKAQAASSAPAVAAPVGPPPPPPPPPALLRLLLHAAQPVHGSWGSGRLIRTSLLSILLTSDGRVLIGAVTPAVLYAAAAKAK